MAPDPHEYVDRIWSGPFDGEVPGQGLVRVGETISVPRHQADAAPHHYRTPQSLDKGDADVSDDGKKKKGGDG